MMVGPNGPSMEDKWSNSEEPEVSNLERSPYKLHFLEKVPRRRRVCKLQSQPGGKVPPLSHQRKSSRDVRPPDTASSVSSPRTPWAPRIGCGGPVTFGGRRGTSEGVGKPSRSMSLPVCRDGHSSWQIAVVTEVTRRTHQGSSGIGDGGPMENRGRAFPMDAVPGAGTHSTTTHDRGSSITVG